MREPWTDPRSEAWQACPVLRIHRLVALLASAAALGGLVELALLRHWAGLQLIPWFVLGLIAVVGGLRAVGGPRIVAQVAGGIGLVGALVGVYQHAAGNHALGPYLVDGWDSLSAVGQWWEAVAGSIAANPPLAPGLLGLAGALLLVSTVREN